MRRDARLAAVPLLLTFGGCASTPDPAEAPSTTASVAGDPASGAPRKGQHPPTGDPASAAAPAGAGAAEEVDPEPPDAQARAVSALPQARVVALKPGIPTTIVGLHGTTTAATSSIRGMGVAVAGAGGDTTAAVKSISGQVRDVEAAMRDLNARVTGQEIHIDLAADVLFDFDQADIRPEAATTLANAAAVIRANPGAAVRVEGHTDSKGKDSYNQGLSERRAGAVIEWLRSREGLGAFNFAVRGFGATKPVAPNQKRDGSDDPEGRQRNRRVEIVVTRRG